MNDSEREDTLRRQRDYSDASCERWARAYAELERHTTELGDALTKAKLNLQSIRLVLDKNENVRACLKHTEALLLECEEHLSIEREQNRHLRQEIDRGPSSSPGAWDFMRRLCSL